ncbi:MAG: phosphate ABC transporter substrate-binding protein PstS [Terracidiphilus sp.]
MRKIAVAVLLLVVALSKASAQRLTGAGSTFSYPIYSKLFNEYDAAHPGVHISYDAIGSGGGIRRISAGVVDFGASDGPMTDLQLAAARVKVLHIPTVLGAVVPIFNLPGVTNLRFSPEVLADIYLRKIVNWNDPRIAKDNPDVTLPSKKIVVVHRSEGSGTTYIFTDYLSKVSKAWAGGPGKGTAPIWPTGIGRTGNKGMAGAVSQLAGAIGYAELTYALENHLSFGAVKNADGNWVKASIEGVTAAAADIRNIPTDFRVSITNAPGEDAYPISSFTWLLVPVRSPDSAKGKVLKELITWMVTSGQSEVSGLSYAPLPKPIADKVLQSIASLR